MKKIAALSVALVTLGITPLGGIAQTRPQSQSAHISSSFNLHASHSTEVPMSFAEVQSITEGSLRASVSSQLQGITTDQVSGQLADKFEDLTQGKTVDLSTCLDRITGLPITQQYSMNVLLHYETRPIGGIVLIEVQLVPAFSGIGAASRPVATLSTSEAVDNLDPDELAEVISENTHQLGVQYAGQ